MQQMEPTNTPILTIRLLDAVLPQKPYAKVNFLGAAKDLLREHQSLANSHGIDLQLFHNKNIGYSGIQLSRHRQSPEWTAIGEEAVQVLWFWYHLFQNENKDLHQNTIEIHERYTPCFLSKPQRYQIRPMLVNDAIAKALNKAPLDKTDTKERLEKYLYGNIQRFLKFIGFQFQKEDHFLKIRVEKVQTYGQAFPVYHGQKKTGFDITFDCNFKLPHTLRLGQSTALGYGEVTYF